jgi:hypothetical protein
MNVSKGVRCVSPINFRKSITRRKPSHYGVARGRRLRKLALIKFCIGAISSGP